jgi:gamma-glutamyltranspeptidase/glutathione hydrolase
MKRRDFLKCAAACGAALVARAKAAEPPRTDSRARDTLIDRQILAARNQGRSTVLGRRGMVCASQPLASMAGVDILKAGGSAVDAAIAANAVLAVTEPFNCGPGGDLFAVVWIEKEKKLYGLNASGRSPYDWNLAEAQNLGFEQIPLYSPFAWSVPGCVSGWDALSRRFGRTKWEKLFEPAKSYAKDGFAVTPIIARDWERIDSRKYPDLAKVYCPQGKAIEYGDVFKNPEIARFFELLQEGGAKEFYEGGIADRIVEYSKKHEGKFSKRDFTDHTADWVEPVSANYRGYDVWELPPNGQGIAALQILNLLEHFDIGKLEPNGAEHLHLFIEAKKLAFEDRAVYYADMDFADVPVKELISKEYAAERVKLINPRKAAQKVQPGRIKASSDTVYLCAADAEGNMVSLIQSTYHGWGSRYCVDGLGICLQNRGQLFSLNPGDANKLEPHKRPFHTIIPAFVTKEGQPKFAFGVMGGDFQPQGHAQVLMNIIDFKMSIQQAGEQPRVEHIESSTPTGLKMVAAGKVGFERGIRDDVKARLEQMGHKLTKSVGAFGGYQGIWRDDDPLRYFGGSDPRKDGMAAAY